MPEDGTQDAGTQDAPVSLVNADGTFSENWKDSLDEDIRGEECLNLVGDFPGAIKQLVHAQRQIGKDKVVLPSETASTEEWADFYKAVGRPETPEDYSVEVQEELKEIFTDDRVANARKMAHELGLTKKQFDGYMKAEMEATAQAITAKAEQAEADKANAETEMRTRFGGAYDERMLMANKLVAEVLTDPEKKMNFLEKYGNDPDIIEFASVVGARLVEGKAMVAELTQATPNEAKAKINEIQQTPGYLEGTLPPAEMQAITNKLRDLNKQAYPEPERQTAFVGLGG